MRLRMIALISTASVVAAAGIAALSDTASASETTNYSYDALGRLVATTRSGGPSNGVNMASCFDRAGNRLRYDTLTTTPSACPTPTPTPTPG